MYCIYTQGDPLPQVTWTKDGKPLTSNDIMEVKYKNGVASLTVEEIYPEDAGRYACKATNAKGAVETSSRVKVTPKRGGASSNGGAAASAAGRQPRVYKHLDSHTVTDGDPVKLECTIACDATFDVVWLHNEKEIKVRHITFIPKHSQAFLNHLKDCSLGQPKFFGVKSADPYVEVWVKT